MTRITHTTPAVIYASSVDGNWEDDSKLKGNAALGCLDIAS